MINKYYTLPFDSQSLLTGQAHEKCDLNESVAHYLHLINTSYFGECTFDESFGCSIWLLDFDNLKSTNNLKGMLLDSLGSSLKAHEKRLTNIKVQVKIKQEELSGAEESNRVKKRVDITVKGKIRKTSEAFSYVEYFYIGPLSY